MGHHHHHHNHNDHGIKNIKLAFFLNVSFTIIEFIGGFYTNSLAIMSDAIHDLGDSLSLAMAWYFQNLSQKKQDANFSYGYKRFSVLGAIINSVILISGSFIIVFRAIPRFFSPEQPDTQGMLYLAILGIIINGIGALNMRKGKSLNEKVVGIHLLEDVLGWVAVLIVSIVMKYYDAPFLDPLLSLLIAVFILQGVYKNLKEAIKIVMQSTPANIDLDRLKKKVLAMDEIKGIHDLHVWSMDGTNHILTLHIILKKCPDNFYDAFAIKQSIRKILKENHINHATIEIENEQNLSELKGHN